MRRYAAEATVTLQTTAIASTLLGGAAVSMLIGVVVSMRPPAIDATIAPLAFALGCTVTSGVLIWRLARHALRACQTLDDCRVRERIVAAMSFDAMLTLGANGVIEVLNHAGERVFGLAQADAVGRDFRTLVDLQSGTTPSFETIGLGATRHAATPRHATGRRTDGSTFDVEVAFADLPSEAGPRVLALVRQLATATASVDDTPSWAAFDAVGPHAPALPTSALGDEPSVDQGIETPGVAEAEPHHPAESPLARASTIAPEPTTSASVKSGPHVLVCDDDPELCAVLEALLRSQGAQPHVVHDVDGAVAAMLETRYDVMLLDLQLAGADGLDVLRTLPSPQSAPLRQVILLSSDASVQIETDDFPVAIVERMEKPIRLDRLRRSVQVAMAGAVTARDEARPIILHVDDDPDIRRLVQDLLASMGEVITVATLFEAKRKLSAIDPDLVVLDIGLGDGSGLELMPLLTSAGGRRIPAIVFSGRTADTRRSGGEVKVFAKSCASFEALAAEARRLLGARRPPDTRAEAA